MEPQKFINTKIFYANIFNVKISRSTVIASVTHYLNICTHALLSAYSRVSLIPRHRPAFHRLQYGACGESLGMRLQ